MNSSALTPSPSSSSCFTKLSKQTNTNTIYYNQFKLHKERERKLIYKSLNCSRSSDSPPSPKIDIQISCSAATETPAGTSYLAADDKLQRLVSEFKSLPKPIDRVKRLLHYAARLPPFDESARVAANRVMGCTAQVWLEVSMDEFGRMRFGADSDSEITKAFCSCLIWVLDGAEPEEVLKVKSEDLSEMNVGLPGKSHSRVNTWHNVLTRMQKRTKALVAEREGKPPVELFPSLVVTADDISAKGSYAEAQARFLFPDYLKVKELVNVLKDKKIGVVAHFYMDPEVQGVLTAAQKLWPHIHISDSLVMADTAVKMAEAGCQFVTVLGVDFMSENVRAILDQAGFRKVGVYRMSNERIGCSLADAAANPAYMNFLMAAAMLPPSLHVIYINTPLETKARAHELVPTITCTSSNVMQTILQWPLTEWTSRRSLIRRGGLELKRLDKRNLIPSVPKPLGKAQRDGYESFLEVLCHIEILPRNQQEMILVWKEEELGVGDYYLVLIKSSRQGKQSLTKKRRRKACSQEMRTEKSGMLRFTNGRVGHCLLSQGQMSSQTASL
ncbi:hypothetical protein L1049_005528 [Liquidambar formosana]|uniref:quinolinate synthase n=1 Tax=Liquidambar formosana TaxID=63359 RepID=A0AAP0RDT0_LIQFO